VLFRKEGDMGLEDFYSGKKIVVTGGSGFVGGTLVEKLVNVGAHVTVLDNGSRGERYIEGTVLYPADVSSIDTCAFWFKDAFAVFNLAASVAGVLHNMSHHLEMYSENLDLQMSPVIAAEMTGVPHFLQVSSVCVYSPRYNHPAYEERGLYETPHEANAGYAESKRDGERVLQWSKLERGIIVRPSNIYGPHDYFDSRAHVIPALIKKVIEDDKIVVYGNTGTVREFIYVDDVADGMIHALMYGENKHAYNLGTHGRTTTTIAQLVDRIKNIAGVPDKHVVFDTSAGGGDLVRYSSCAKIHDLGWKSTVGLDEGLKKTIDWYNAQL
jgi:GDP-L-fucose synthase